MAAYQRAALGEGESFRARAAEHFVLLEKQFAEELAKRMNEAFARADDPSAFAGLADLRQLAKSSKSAEVLDFIAKLELPFTIKVDSPFATLVMKRKGVPDEIMRAPKDSNGSWTQIVHYPIDTNGTVEVRRAGFTSQAVMLSAEGKRSQAAITLKRGPIWQTDLGAIPTTTPVASGKFLLVGTNKSTLEVIDPGLGTARAITFSDSVSEITAAPMVYKNRAYTVIDDKITAIDIDTRAVIWTWPPANAISQPGFFPASLWVQQH